MLQKYPILTENALETFRPVKSTPEDCYLYASINECSNNEKNAF